MHNNRVYDLEMLYIESTSCTRCTVFISRYFMKGVFMTDQRRKEVVSQLTDHPQTVDFLCGLPEDRYQVVFPLMKLIKMLDYQHVSNNDIKAAEDVRAAYSLENMSKVVLMAFLYDFNNSHLSFPAI